MDFRKYISKVVDFVERRFSFTYETTDLDCDLNPFDEGFIREMGQEYERDMLFDEHSLRGSGLFFYH